MKGETILSGNKRSLFLTNIGALISGGFGAAICLIVRLYFWAVVCLATVVIYAVVDFLLWKQRGIYRIDRMPDGLIVFTPLHPGGIPLPSVDIVELQITLKRGRTVIYIEIGADSARKSFFPDRKLLIHEDLYKPDLFQQFWTYLETTYPSKCRKKTF